MAFAQTDLKRLIAYTSVSHLGFVLLGVFAWNALALQGAVIQMLSHGVSTGALFALAGVLQHHLGTRDVAAMGGLWRVVPRLGAALMLISMAALGLPGMGNFIGELLVLLGAYRVSVPLTVVAAGGLILALVYALWLLDGVLYGPPEHPQVPDLRPAELAVVLVLALAILWLGLAPQAFLNISGPTLATVLGSGGCTVNPLGSMAAPIIATGITAVAVMLVIGAYRSHRMTVFVTLVGLLSGLLLTALAWPLPNPVETPLLLLDYYAFFYHGLFLLVALVLTLLGYGYLQRHETQREEYYLLLLLALAFAVGAATGLTREFQFGTNWASYSRFVGDVFGPFLATEAIVAFFLESTLLYVLLFGYDRIPSGLSLLLGLRRDHLVQGLHSFPRDAWAPVPYMFFPFHLMIALGVYLLWRRRLARRRWYLWLAVLTTPLPFVANELGWMASEVGRQPWLVYNVYRTSEGVSKVVPAGHVWVSMIVLSLVYLLLFIIWWAFIWHAVRKGPAVEEGDA